VSSASWSLSHGCQPGAGGPAEDSDALGWVFSATDVWARSFLITGTALCTV
jgi:hypothetical protein